MRDSALRHPAVVIGIAVVSLTGCGAGSPPLGGAPQVANLRARDVARANNGIYVSVQYGNDVFGFLSSNRRNKPPRCTIQTPVAGDVAVDMKGNLIVPSYSDPSSYSFVSTIDVYAGPGICGHKVASIPDPDGLPFDAASMDARKGKIIVANEEQGTDFDPGNVAVCTIKHGCTPLLYGDGSNFNYVQAVALAKNGDCWSSNIDVSYAPSLLYYKRCTGTGQYAVGFQDLDPVGLDIDGAGNLVSISSSDAKLYVYKGCDPMCTLIGGPFQLIGRPLYGHLNQNSTRFVVGDRGTGAVDVYAYNPTNLRYEFSFSNGLTQSDGVSGAAYNPRSSE